jgi:hypothetical protein
MAWVTNVNIVLTHSDDTGLIKLKHYVLQRLWTQPVIGHNGLLWVVNELDMH